MKKINVVKDADNPIAVEVIEQSIIDIGDAMKRISQTRLNRKALVVLISKDTGIGQGTIESILDSLDSLETTYLKPK